MQPLLSSALGKDYQVLSSPNEAEITRFLDADECDVAILDLDVKQSPSEKRSLEQRLECFRRIITSRESAAILIMADDTLRSNAAELVRLGAYGYLRRPPSIRDLKAMLLRANEHGSLRRELQSAQQRLETVVAAIA